MVLLQNEDNKDGVTQFRATYVLRDGRDAVPEYLLEFNVDPVSICDDDGDGASSPIQYCGACNGSQDRPAIYFIEQDGWLFCQECLDELFRMVRVSSFRMRRS